VKYKYKYVNVNVKKLISLKLTVRTIRDDITPLKHQNSSKIFSVTLDVAMHEEAYGRLMRSPIYGYPKDFCCFSRVISSHSPYSEF